MTGNDTPENSGAEQKPKRKGGRFIKGASGNPRGKPPGSRHKSTLLLEKLADDAAENFGNVLITRALAGDPTATTVLAARLWPVRRYRVSPFDLGPIGTYDEIVAAQSRLVEATARGEVEAEQAEAIEGRLKGLLDVRQQHELVDRLTRLEELLKARAS